MSAAVDAVFPEHAAALASPAHPGRQAAVERLETELTELWGHINAANYRFLALLADFDRLRGYEIYGLAGTAQWLNWQCGIGSLAARERVRVARALGNLPLISDAFRRGVISYSKVRAMTRVARPEDEDVLLNTALHGTAAHVERHVRAFRFCQRRDEAKQANDRHRRRYLNVYHDADGSVVIHAVLPPDVGALVEKAISSAVDDVDEPAAVETESNVSAETRQSRSTETESNVSAETRVSARTPGSDPTAEDRPRRAREVSESHEEVDGHRPFGAQRADALALLAETFLARQTERRGTVADRYQVCVHIDQRLLSKSASTADEPVPAAPADGPAPAGGPAQPAPATGRDAPSPAAAAPLRHDLLQHCELEGSERVLAIETARRLGCDASLVGIVDDAEGNPLDVGRRTRSIPPALQRALRARDGGCRFPGCDRSRYTEGHHIVHWADGGETKLANLVTLCRYHHRLVHEGGFGLHARDDCAERDRFVFVRPDGTRIAPNGRLPVRAGPVTRPSGETLEPPDAGTLEELLYERNRQAGLDIDADTSRCGWRGETFDVSTAVEAQQWQREHAQRLERGADDGLERERARVLS